MATKVDPIKLHPLDLPEIRTYVVSYLTASKSDLIACLCVSKAWQQTCLPHLWASFDFRRFQDQQLTSRGEGIIRNGHLIRRVGLEHMQVYSLNGAHLQDYVLPYCHNLQKIEFSEALIMDDDDEALDKDRLRLKEWEDITALVRQNPGLEVFRIENSNVWTIPVGFWKALSENVPDLRSVQILRATVGIDDSLESVNNSVNNGVSGNVSTNCSNDGGQDGDEIVDLFLDICDRVEELHLDAVVFARTKTERWNDGSTFSRLQKLTYFGRSTMQFELFHKALDATGLKELTWGSQFRAVEHPAIIAPFLTAEIVKRHLALDALDLWEEIPFEDRELQAILSSLSRPLLKLCVKDSEFSTQALQVLLQPRLSWARWPGANGDGTGTMASHGSVIRTLNLQGCVLVSSSMVQRLLQSCPQLEVFVAWEIKGSDILNAQNDQQPTWACRSLKELEVFISVFSPARDALRQGTTTAPGYRTTAAAAATASVVSGWGVGGLESSSSPSSSLLGMPPPPPPPGMAIFSEPERQIHSAIYRELGVLTNLERLVIGKARLATEYYQNPAVEQGLDLRLTSGLNSLAGLRQLRELDFRNTPQNLSELEVEWMAEYFCEMREAPLGRYSGYIEQRNLDLKARFISARLEMLAEQWM
ncbi:hypothetical protein BGZ95_001580 [Linnemannia exigua]|uniref:F-box domain-containing protein n=1 Tax=Linnemannia exigua TaxID=604196 RepID=A0AAD4D792_9FUNG|nr:hypothetical protein BGZ95_001580 [Linnemannia exigua]